MGLFVPMFVIFYYRTNIVGLSFEFSENNESLIFKMKKSDSNNRIGFFLTIENL